MENQIKSISKNDMMEMFKSNITIVNRFASPIICRDKYGKVQKRSCTYPIEYIVTDELQEIASEYRKKMEKECLNQIKDGDLVLLRMGCNFRETRDLQNSDLENHRLRLSFIDKSGVHVVGDICGCHPNGSKIYGNHQLDAPVMSFDLQYNDENGSYIYKCLELAKYKPTYTKKSLLNIINRYSTKQYKRVFLCNECVSYEKFKKAINY